MSDIVMYSPWEFVQPAFIDLYYEYYEVWDFVNILTQYIMPHTHIFTSVHCLINGWFDFDKGLVNTVAIIAIYAEVLITDD